MEVQNRKQSAVTFPGFTLIHISNLVAASVTGQASQATTESGQQALSLQWLQNACESSRYLSHNGALYLCDTAATIGLPWNVHDSQLAMGIAATGNSHDHPGHLLSVSSMFPFAFFSAFLEGWEILKTHNVVHHETIRKLGK